MRTSHLFTLLAVVGLACTETPIPPRVPDDYGEGLISRNQTVVGTLISPNQLLSQKGDVVPLVGPQTKMLPSLIGAELRILGSEDELGSATLWIVEFRVLAVDGIPALDGRLDRTENGFAIATRPFHGA